MKEARGVMRREGGGGKRKNDKRDINTKLTR